MKCSVLVRDTDRVVHVTLRFFMFMMSFAIFELANVQNLKAKGL